VTHSSIVAFLEKQLQDEEDAARRMEAVYPTPWDSYDRGWMVRVQAGPPGWHEVVRLEQKFAPEGLEWLAGAIEHVALQAPDQTIRRIEAMRALIADISAEKHRVIDDQYYTCPAATEERDGGSYGETDGGGWCSCGRDERVQRRLRHLASVYPDCPEEWKP
jgi:hypothetical protein